MTGQAVHDDRLKDVLAILQVFLRHQRADDLKASLRERAARALQTITGDDTVSYLVGQLRTEAGELIEDLSDVLVDLGPPVIPRILDRLATENQDAARLWIVATLARLHEAVEADLTQVLQTLERDQACRLAPILAGIGGETGMALLTSLFRHREPRVRSEVVRGLGRFEATAVQSLLMRAVRDPDLAVLEAAVSLVGATKLRLAMPTLLRLARQHVLRGKPFAVRKAAIAALGAMGDLGFLPILRGLLYARTWFQRAAGNELRQAAALALLAMGRPEAREVVEAGARSRRGGVRRASLAALRAAPAQE
jgi:HEAT repeat protein